MKIIKVGKKPEDKEYEFTCPKCKSILSAKLSEGKITYDQRDGNFVTFICIICNSNCYVDLKFFK